MSLSRFLPAALKRRMARYTPRRFSDPTSCGAFYDARHDLFSGEDLLVLEYSTRDAQRRLFDRATRLLPPEGRVLDLGCGLGDFLSYLEESGTSFADYRGIDVSERMVVEAQRRHGERFERRDLLVDPLEKEGFATGYILSVLGYPIGDRPLETMIEIVRRTFVACRVGVVFSHLAAGRKEGLAFTTVPVELALRLSQELGAQATLDDDGTDFTYLLALRH